MALEAGIVGLPNVGKSTLFNALTAAGALAANYPFATIEPNVGVVAVPDPRLDVIQSFIKTQKIIPASMRLVDIAGIVRGASEGEGLGNKFLSHIREVDAICHVVRCFENTGGDDITHVDGSVDPIRDIETIETELMLADLQTLETARGKAQRAARSNDPEAKMRFDLIDKLTPGLEAGESVLKQLAAGKVEASGDRAKVLRGLGLISAKKVLYIANVDENDPTGEGPHASAVRARAAEEGMGVVPVCAKIESELAELDEADKLEMLEAVGLAEPALHSVAREAYKLLGMHSYFTAGEKEVRAWPIPVGATAPQAAGVIHTDFERGFIRAEVYSVDDLTQHKSEKAIREAGKMRIEGKEYIMHDSDVVHFLFNV